MKQRIYETKCRRCGKPIFTTRQSLLGMDNLKVKYGGICEACMPRRAIPNAKRNGRSYRRGRSGWWKVKLEVKVGS